MAVADPQILSTVSTESGVRANAIKIHVLTQAAARRVANASQQQASRSRQCRPRRRQPAHRRRRYTPSARSHLRRCEDRNRILTHFERPAMTMMYGARITYARDRRRPIRYHILLCPRATYLPRGGDTSPPLHKSAVCLRPPTVGPIHRLRICWVTIETELSDGIRLLRNVGSRRTSSVMPVGLGVRSLNDTTSGAMSRQ